MNRWLTNTVIFCGVSSVLVACAGTDGMELTDETSRTSHAMYRARAGDQVPSPLEDRFDDLQHLFEHAGATMDDGEPLAASSGDPNLLSMIQRLPPTQMPTAYGSDVHSQVEMDRPLFDDTGDGPLPDDTGDRPLFDYTVDHPLPDDTGDDPPFDCIFDDPPRLEDIPRSAVVSGGREQRLPTNRVRQNDLDQAPETPRDCTPPVKRVRETAKAGPSNDERMEKNRQSAKDCRRRKKAAHERLTEELRQAKETIRELEQKTSELTRLLAERAPGTSLQH